ncbi:MAG: MauE/DoxX family redox-associated membrane protein [Egibacteraceae bacterium]
MSYLLIGQRCLLAAVFGVAFIGKVRDASRFKNFVTSIQKLTRFPARTATFVALTIVICEGAAGALLAFPFAPQLASKVGFALAAGLLAVFIAVVVRAVRGGVLAECRCFGRSGSVMSNAMIVRNLLLMAFAVPGIIMSPAAPATDPAYTALAMAAGFALALCFVRYYDQIIRVILQRLSPSATTHGPSTKEPRDDQSHRPSHAHAQR